MPRVKICGITNPEDARLACDLGADALGFIFYARSPRSITPDRARAIAGALPPFLTKVGVFVNESAQVIREITDRVGLNLVQLHGGESPKYCRELRLPYTKVFRVQADFDVQEMGKYVDAVGFVFDTYRHDAYGGTGETFDWAIARQATQYGSIILSGGLSANNVRAAIETVQPYAVDVASGVEAEPGKKDPNKLRAFFHSVNEEMEASR